jgi:hypothetical protein
MQSGGSFSDEVTASNAKDAAKKLFSSLVKYMHNMDKVDMLISFHKKENQSGKTFNYKCTKAGAEDNSKMTVSSYSIPAKAVSAGTWGEQSGGRDGDAMRKKIRKKMEKKKGKKKVDSDTDSDSDSDLDSYVEPVYFVYDPFYYGNYLYSSYILGRSILLPNFAYNLSGYWYY